MNILSIIPDELDLDETYLSANEYTKDNNILVISKVLINQQNNDCINILYNTDEELSSVIMERLKIFQADCISLKAYRKWPDLVKELRQRGILIPIFLEVKSYFVSLGDKDQEIKNIFYENQFLINGVIGHTICEVKSWIKEIKIPIYETEQYVGEKTNKSLSKMYKCAIDCLSSNSEEISHMFNLVNLLPNDLKKKFKIDIYVSQKIDGLQEVVENSNTVLEINTNIPYDNYDINVLGLSENLVKDELTQRLLNFECLSTPLIIDNKNIHLSKSYNVFSYSIENKNSFINAFESAFNTLSNYKEKRKFKKNVLNNVSEFYSDILNFWKSTNNAIGINIRMKILYISPRPFGLMATQGTYLLAEGYSLYSDFSIIHNINKTENDHIVYEASSNVKKIGIDFSDQRYMDKILAKIEKIQPHLVCIGSQSKWDILAKKIKDSYENILISLEIKTPLFGLGERAEYFNERHQIGFQYIDMIIAPSLAMTSTWFGEDFTDILKTKFLSHRQVLNINNMKNVQDNTEQKKEIKLIFVGSLTKTRSIDQLIKLISLLPDEILIKCQFDFYGDGNAKEELIDLSKQLNLENIVFFKGSVSQSVLYSLYQMYNIGIAWVPQESFNSAPSLKLLEYLAAGLIPLATDNIGHKYIEKYGFTINYFSPDADSFRDALFQIIELVHTDKLNENITMNAKYALDHHYLEVVKKEIFPYYIDNLRPYIYKCWLQTLKDDFIFDNINDMLMSKEVLQERIYHQKKYKDLLK